MPVHSNKNYCKDLKHVYSLSWLLHLTFSYFSSLAILFHKSMSKHQHEVENVNYCSTKNTRNIDDDWYLNLKAC